MGLAAEAGGPDWVCPDGSPGKFLGPVALNYDQGNLGSRTNAQAAAIVDNARALWNNVSTATVTINRGADLPADVTAANFAAYRSSGDGLNPVIYDNDGALIDNALGVGASNSVLAFANVGMTYSSVDPCRLFEGYLLVNGKIGASDTTLTNAVAREIGHFIGLDNTQLGAAQGLSIGAYPLMYPLQGYRNTVSLHEDDVAAVSALYPDASVNSTYGTVTGTFVLPDGTPIRGANIWTRNESTGEVFSSVSDHLEQGNGYFKLALTPGTYHLHAEAIDAAFWGWYGVGPHARTQAGASFQPPLYSGGTPMNPVTQLTQLNVVAGCTMDVTFRSNGGSTIGSASCLPAAPSELIDPAGRGISGPGAHFQWTAGIAVTERYLMVGTTRGGSELYAGYQGNLLSRYLDNIPLDGSTIFVRLMSYANGGWQVRDYSFIAPVIGTPSTIVSPAPGSTLGSSATFQWTAGVNVSGRLLDVGSVISGNDINGGNQGASLSRLVTGIPQDGRKIYVRVTSLISNALFAVDYTYVAGVASTPPRKSQLTSPSAGSLLAGASATFQWDAGVSVGERYLMVGSSAGASDIFGGYEGAALSATVTGIPTDGRTIYVTLSSWVNGAWQNSTATYTAAGAVPTPVMSNLTSPANGSVLAGSIVTFQWTAGVGVMERYFALGTSSGSSDIFGGYEGASLSQSVSGIPTDGRTIYSTLSSWIGGGWQTSTATFTAASSGGGPAPSGPASEITSPVPGASLGAPGSTSATFTWTAGTGVTERYLMVGTSPGGSQIYAAYQGAALSRTVSGIPCGTVTTYVRLMSYVGGSWVVNNYTYTSAGCPLP